VIYYAGAWHRATPFCDFSLDDVTPGRVVFNDVEFGTEGEAMIFAGSANWMPFHFPQDSDTPPVTYNDISINPSEDLGLDFSVTEENPILTALPSYESMGEKKVVGLTGTGNSVNISVTAPAGSWHGSVYYGGAWHQSSPEFIGVDAVDRLMSFTGVDFTAKDGEVIVLLSEGGESTLPVELSSFAAVVTAQNYVNLSWQTASETSILGYRVYRNTGTASFEEALLISNLISATNSSQTQVYNFIDSELEEEGDYYYWLQSIDFGGVTEEYGPLLLEYEIEGDDVETPEIGPVTGLKAPFPNPFNPTLMIPYNLAQNEAVRIEIHNVRGQLVKTLNPGSQPAGEYHVVWDGRDMQGDICSTGVYYLSFKAGNTNQVRKVIMMK